MCETKVAQILEFFKILVKSQKLGSWGFFSSYQSINKPNKGFSLIFEISPEKKWIGNFKHFEQLLFHTFYPQIIFIFSLIIYKYRVFRK